MELATIASRLLAGETIVEHLDAPLDAPTAEQVVDDLKREADRHFWINANRSLELADLIVQLGRLQESVQHTALGLMTRGDALKFLGQTRAAWDALDEAGALFLSIGNEVGWARTRIGRLLICVDLRAVDEALADAERARVIFARHGLREKQIVLDLNTAIVHDLLGEQQRALGLYNGAIAVAEQLGEPGRPYLGLLYNSAGVAYETLGNFRDALTYYERAYLAFLERDEMSAATITRQNIAYIAIDQGQYRHALAILHDVLRLNSAEGLPLDAAHAKRAMVECYLGLNRYAEARDLAREVVAEYQSFGVTYKEALTLLLLATAEAELGSLAEAQRHLDTAEISFEALGAEALIAITRLVRGQVALRRGDLAAAQQAAELTVATLAAGGQLVEYATAMLLRSRALLARQDLPAARASGEAALTVARESNVPALRYTAHLLLGQIAEARGAHLRAERHYIAAAATTTRVQRGLTITLRPGFLEDKGEALRALISLYLRQGNAQQAFAALERAKSQQLLSYLVNREQLRWSAHDEGSEALIAQLNQLRAEHQWFYRLAHERVRHDRDATVVLDPAQSRVEVAARERQMRAIAEQLYLRSAESDGARFVAVPSWREVQATLAADEALIEFYSDGAALWAFTLDHAGLCVHPLGAVVQEISRKIQQLQLNLSAALVAGQQRQVVDHLARSARLLLQQLNDALLQPLAATIGGRRRLLIVPYGVLHYMPFHLLHTGKAYLIESAEVVILPAAGLATRPAFSRPGGARVIAHSWEGRLPNTLREAELVRNLVGGEMYQEHHARREALSLTPSRILHIAAHGKYRLDQPDLSYIELHDGQLYSDDLLQQDLSYELVTLSACETGRANVAAGDELIGLGRGFLYAGAGALIASLWRVPDDTVLELMEHLYRRLLAGDSKATALRGAQLAAIGRDPGRHPALWGAFQLVGDPRPLTFMR